MVRYVYFSDLRSLYLEGILLDSEGIVSSASADGLLLDDSVLSSRLGSSPYDIAMRSDGDSYYLEDGHDIFATLLYGYQERPLDSSYKGLRLRVEFR